MLLLFTTTQAFSIDGNLEEMKYSRILSKKNRFYSLFDLMNLKPIKKNPLAYKSVYEAKEKDTKIILREDSKRRIIIRML